MYKLSPSSLNLYLECPRCFWLKLNKGVKRPETPSSTLPSGVDYSLKNYYDYHRENGLPPELRGALGEKLNLCQNQNLVREIRKISFGIQITDDIWFGGALDDALETPDGRLVPLDNKTRGFPPREPHWTHTMQMSGYTLILRERGFKTENVAYLAYWFLDHKNMNLENPLGFRTAVEEIKTRPDEVRGKILEAVSALKKPEPENAAENCGFCAYHGADG